MNGPYKNARPFGCGADPMTPTKQNPRAQEPLHYTLRAIVALSENIIDDQDPSREFPAVTVNEAGRAIRRCANDAMRQAVRLHESNAALESALEAARSRLDFIASALAQGHTISIGSVQNCAAQARAALQSAKH